jgi:hypothetical protein
MAWDYRFQIDFLLQLRPDTQALLRREADAGNVQDRGRSADLDSRWIIQHGADS